MIFDRYSIVRPDPKKTKRKSCISLGKPIICKDINKSKLFSWMPIAVSIWKKKNPFFFFWYLLWCNWSLLLEKNQFKYYFMALVATRSMRYCFKRSSYRSSLWILGYLLWDLWALLDRSKIIKTKFYVL